MTEKEFKESEIKKVFRKVYSNYLKHYSHGKMEFNELILIEHFMLTLEQEFDKCGDDSDD